MNKKVQVILMTTLLTKGKGGKNICVFLKSISVTNLAQRLCCDHNSQAKQNLAPEKNCQN